ncbi:MAG: bifunctional folylpolyglutamate synthase/dihydrofolate synthase [Bacteroidetes bacterium]|nr:bifunctional folylpolyglutamate synthase/dihydrofolate synthase [Bacteroidota bacterium]
MGNPEYSVPMIHIAGTNGKGSVSHILSAMFQDVGLDVGLYTSPHYIDFRERIRYNVDPISKDEVVQFVEKYESLFAEVTPSFFEWTFALALFFFEYRRPDVAIIETGLGGRLDSTNIIHPILSVITNVSLDHQAILGDTIPEIASEKLGIVKNEVPLLLGEKSIAYQELAEEKADKMNAPLHFAEDKYTVSKAEAYHRDSCIQGQWVKVESSGRKSFTTLLDLNGDYQLSNLQTALASFELAAQDLQVPKNDWKESQVFSQIRPMSGMIGRWQLVSENPPVILDGAHNEAAIESVFKSFLEINAERYFVILGVSSDKDMNKVLSNLPPFMEYHFTQAGVPRAQHFSHYLDLAKSTFGLKAVGHEKISFAYDHVMKKATPYDAVLITGSIFLVGEWLEQNKELG